MRKGDEFFEALEYDEEGHVVWPEDPEERRRVASGLLGSKVIESVQSATQEMLSHVDGRWPAPGSARYEDDIRVAEQFKAMSPEQRAAVESLVEQTARLVGFSIFLGVEHFGPGRVEMSVRPISKGEIAGGPIGLAVVEWQQAYLDWEEQFGEGRRTRR